MKFGIFLEEMRRGVGQEAAFADLVRLADAAEAWGLDGVWLGEIHFNPARSVLSAPLLMAGAIAARTQRLRVGTAVTLLPLGHPLRIAEEVATVDQLSRGRFDFGIGRSGGLRAYDVFRIPYAESQGRLQEALEIIREAWKGERFSYHGQFYHVDDALVSPRPYQQPHPTIRMAANSPETFETVGRQGLALFVGLRANDVADLQEGLRAYRRAWQKAGHPGEGSVHLRIPVYAGPTEKAAREDPYETITYFMSRQAEITRAPAGRDGTGPAERRQERADRLANLTYDEILQRKVAFGTAVGLIERLTQLREALGLDGLVAELNPGGLLAPELELQSLRILTHEVMPAFR